MSRATAMQAPAPSWVGTLLHAAVGLVLLALLIAGALVYVFQAAAPALLPEHVRLIFERYATPTPDPRDAGGLLLWLAMGGAFFLGCLGLGFWAGWRNWGDSFAASQNVVLRTIEIALFAVISAPVFVAVTIGYLLGRNVRPVIVLPILAALAGMLAAVGIVGLMVHPRYVPGVWAWWFITATVLSAGFFYVAAMYSRDARGVGPLWAVLLGLLRAVVFTALAFFFMLPAVGEYHEESHRSKVLVVFDVSGSMVYEKDDVPDDAHPLDSLPTRQDKVMAFLADDKENFLKRLEAKNPVDVFRMARSLDPDYLHFSKDNRNWTRAEFDAWMKGPDRDRNSPPPGDLPPEFWAAWLKPDTDVKTPDEWAADRKERFRRLLNLNDDLIEKDAAFLNNTNVGDSLLTLVDNESKKMLQGIIVFTDGRSTEGSATAFEQLKDHARRDHVPLFIVAIGEERPRVKVEIVDLRVPQQIQPDDKFPAVVEVTGEGLPDQPASVELELNYVHKGAEGKEEPLAVKLRESVDEKPGATSAAKPQEVLLPSQIVLRPPQVAKFDTGNPPRAEIQFQIDAAALAAAAGVDLTKGAFGAVHKWEIAETLPDSEFRFRAHVPRAPKEIFAAKEHVSDPAGLIVQKKPLRVLLFASAATHEYQFVQAILVRDQTKGRVKVSAFLQPPPGQKDPREGVIQDAQLLTKFPDQFDVGPDKKDDNPYDLSDYDVIVAFDPDWDQLTDKQISLLFGRDEVDPNGKTVHIDGWVDKGGGFVCVAGPVNTVELAGPREDEKRRFGPILDKLPVIPKDIRLEEVNRDTERAWPLDFKDATPDLEFLRLKEDTADQPVKFLDDWKDFFGPIQPDRSVGRGFYNFYPVESAKPGSQTAAYFGDPSVKSKNSKGEESLMPYIVLSNPADVNTRVVWLGWGEMWRLRQKNEAYLERFWTKLTHYAGGLHHGKVIKRITTNFGRLFTVGQPIVMEAKIEGKGGEPLPDDAKPTIKITAPRLASKITEEDARKLKELAAHGDDLSAADRLLRDQLQRTQDEDERQKQDVDDLEKKDWVMTPKLNNPGWFQVRFQAPVEGAYQMDLTVSETGDKVSHKFTVKPSDPERDNTRPDFARMYETASYLDEDVQPRMTSTDYAELAQKLQRPKLEEGATQDDRPRLYFNLSNAGLIPKCMSETESTTTTHSDPHSIWGEHTPFGWLSPWLAGAAAFGLTLGFVVAFVFFRDPRPSLSRQYQGALAAAAMLVALAAHAVSGQGGYVGIAIALLIGLVCLGGYQAGRNLGWGGWVLLAGAIALLIGPLFLPVLIQLGWLALAVLIALMSAEWLVRKLLRLA